MHKYQNLQAKDDVTKLLMYVLTISAKCEIN